MENREHVMKPSEDQHSVSESGEYAGHPTQDSKTGCVNISVLMPVLAVAVMSLLLFIHLLIRGKWAQDNLRDRKMKHNEECSSQHSEASTSVIEEPIELQANRYVSSAHHANGHVPRTPMNGRALSHSPGFKHSSRALVSENATSSPVFTRMSRFHVNGEESQSPVNRLSSPRSDNELSSDTNGARSRTGGDTVLSKLSLTNSCYRSCAHGQGLLCLQLRADEA